MDTVRLDDGLLRTTLPNGLVVLSEQLPGVRSAATGLFVRTASAAWKPGWEISFSVASPQAVATGLPDSVPAW